MKTKKNIRDNFNRKKLSSAHRVLLVVLLITLVSLSCSLPLGFLQSGTPEENLEEALAGGGLLNVEEISISEDQVVIEYAQLMENDPEVMVSGWLASLQAAAEAAPEAVEIILRTNFTGEPYLEITAKTEKVNALTAGDMTQEAFLETLEIVDLRPLETRIFGQLVEKWIDVVDVSQSGGSLVIEYYPEPAETKSDLMDEWLEIFVIVLKGEAPVDTVQIRALMLDTSVFVVEGTMEDLQAFYGGEITAFQFLAGLEIVEELVDLGED